MCIGDEDPMVQLRWARLTEQGVKAMGFKQYNFKEYENMGHSSCDQVRHRLITLQLMCSSWSFHSLFAVCLGNARCDRFYCQTSPKN